MSSRISEFAMHFLINATWQMTAIVLGASICARLLQNVAARCRHALWIETRRVTSRLDYAARWQAGCLSLLL